MCGIAGQLRPAGERVSPELAARMCAALRHRGPDARGIFRDDRAFLGIQRLRVIDLSTGDQPVFNEDRSVAVVLNGEIYNFAELRRGLRARGHRFATQGDTEVIAHLYEEHGADCVLHLHGMFAFALWDGRRRQLLIARDRIGKKPLVYALHDGVLSFASEMAALLEDRAIPRDVDHVALDRYLALGYVPAPLTALRAVRKLPPAHRLVMRDGAVSVDRYWALDYSRKLDDAPVEELCERIREALRVATRRRMISDVPLGAFLSGGIDSSAVVAAMAEASAEPVRTFSIGFDHAAFDELPHARRIARQFGTVHEEFEVRADAVAVVPRIVRHHGEPFADPSAIPSFYLADMTRRHVTVALNGDGGDESFGGYERYRAVALARALERVPRPALGLAARGARALPSGRTEMRSPAFRAARFLETAALDPAARYGRLMELFPAALRRELWADEVLAQLGAPAPAAELLGPPRAPGIRGLQLLDLETYLPGDLLVKADLASMAASLELRAPLLDHEVVELGLSLPDRLKASRTRGKLALRRAFAAELPPQVLDAPKRGFGVPIARWLREDLRELARDALLDDAARARGWFRPGAVERLLREHADGVVDHGARLWALLMLELWQRTHLDAR